MPVKQHKPYTHASRFTTTLDRSDLTRKPAEKRLLAVSNSKGGRNNLGRKTVWSRGGGHKRQLRLVDFKRDKSGIPATVKAIEYDPNRTANIALLFYADGEKRYIIAPLGLKIGDRIASGSGLEIQPGNAMPLAEVPLGTFVHNIELRPGKGGQVARGAGAGAQMMAKDGDYVLLRMPSGEVRKFRFDCMATVGQVGNLDREQVSLGKAGRARWLGQRPHTRGVAKNPVDHPMGGGEGKASGGRHPCTPWGKPTKGYKTRKPKSSDRLIVERRKKG
ncbi:MAG: 50S ribosomal protein L2 [Calditrichaeota bacterium]|nr:50S ribosomal protein L2 [Calditrichota bacterium]